MKKITSNVRNKTDLMNIWTEDAIQNKTIFNVQEIFDCTEHEFMGKSDWCYKDWDVLEKVKI